MQGKHNELGSRVDEGIFVDYDGSNVVISYQKE